MNRPTSPALRGHILIAALIALPVAPGAGPAPARAQDTLGAGGGFANVIMSSCETDLRVLNQVSGWPARWPGALEQAAVGTSDERDATLALWSQIPDALAADLAALREGIGAGTTAPKAVVRRVLAQVDGILAEPADSSALLSPARRSPDRAFAAEWRRRVETTFLPAIRDYRDFLASEYLTAAREAPGLVATPDGAACYERLIESWTSLPMTPAEVESVGRRELVRLQAELVALAAPRYGTSAAEILDRLRNGPLPDPFRTRDDVVRHATAAIERAATVVDQWIGTPGDVPVDVVPIPQFMESSFPAGFYRGPGADGVAAYVVNTSRPAERRLLSEAVAFHEAIPGHHTHASARATGPAGGAFVSGLAEGWAIYAEGLADEMGLYSSELDRIGHIAKYLWATSRLVVEPGIHVRGWSRDRAIRFMLENTTLAPEEIALEVDRYLAIPGQSLSYMLGNLHIRRVRDRAEARLGDDFDIRAFHDVILTRGMRPLPRVADDVEEWTATVAGGGIRGGPRRSPAPPMPGRTP